MLPRLCHVYQRNVNPCTVFFNKFSTHTELPVSKFIKYPGQDVEDIKEPEPETKKTKIPIITCKNSKLNFYKGQSFSKFLPLPLATSGWRSYKAKGDYFTIHPIKEEPPKIKKRKTTFNDLGISDELVSNVHNYLDIKTPTEIQEKGIPSILSSRNTKLAAETGCGKTLAYLLPLIDQVKMWKNTFDRKFNHPLALIVTPSRELAIQIGRAANKVTRGLNVRTKVILSGTLKKKLYHPPASDVDILVGSLGSLSKHLTLNIYKTKFVRHVVLDEADCLFDETFYEKLRHLLRRAAFGPIQDFENSFPKYSQLTLVSATMPQLLEETLEDIVDPSSLEEVSTSKLHQVLVTQKFFRLGVQEKPMALLKLVKSKARNKSSMIIFCNNSITCDWLSQFLHEFDVRNAHLNGEMPLALRKGKFHDFQYGKYNVLCTTDAGSRGLDTISVKDVINYDFPLQTAEYIHRCGRTARVGSPKDCRVISFIARPLEILLAQKIEKAIRLGKPIPLCDFLKRKWAADEAENDLESKQFGGLENENEEYEMSLDESSDHVYNESDDNSNEDHHFVENKTY